MTNIIIRTIEFIILFLWTIIGPFFWLPFLVRMVALFIGAVIVSSGGESNMKVAQSGLDKAARFYPEGFKNIHNSINSIVDKNVSHEVSWNPVKDFWQPLAIHAISVMIFWTITVIGIIKLLTY